MDSDVQSRVLQPHGQHSVLKLEEQLAALLSSIDLLLLLDRLQTSLLQRAPAGITLSMETIVLSTKRPVGVDTYEIDAEQPDGLCATASATSWRQQSRRQTHASSSAPTWTSRQDQTMCTERAERQASSKEIPTTCVWTSKQHFIRDPVRACTPLALA